MGNIQTIIVKVKNRKLGKGSRKIGRNMVKCALYRALGKREKIRPGRSGKINPSLDSRK